MDLITIYGPNYYMDTLVPCGRGDAIQEVKDASVVPLGAGSVGSAKQVHEEHHLGV